MGGPIVRTGTTPKFWQNWEQAFGKKKSKSASVTKTADSKPAAKSPKAVKKAATKSAGAAKKAGSKKKAISAESSRAAQFNLSRATRRKDAENGWLGRDKEA